MKQHKTLKRAPLRNVSPCSALINPSRNVLSRNVHLSIDTRMTRAIVAALSTARVRSRQMRSSARASTGHGAPFLWSSQEGACVRAVSPSLPHGRGTDGGSACGDASPLKDHASQMRDTEQYYSPYILWMPLRS
jgi:hypothetical protein